MLLFLSNWVLILLNVLRCTAREGQIKFVNAVLRSLDRESESLVNRTSILDNVSPMLAASWIETYGENATYKIVEAAMAQSPIFITVNAPPESTKENRIAKTERIRDIFSDLSVGEEKAELLTHGSVRVPEQQSSIVSKWPGYESGEWWVQDPSASLPAIALCNVMESDRNVLNGLHVVDLCSAPGGKTAQLCSLGFGKVTAVEISSKRVRQLRGNLSRLGMLERCKISEMDGRKWKPEKSEQVNAVLLDAPCSATGVGSRRPDVLQKSPEQLKEMMKLQRELAIHAVDSLLSTGGIMVYATCSLLKSESEEQMQWLMRRQDGADVETIPFEPGELPGFDKAIDENGWLRVIPGHLSGSLSYCDGFFVARIRKK